LPADELNDAQLNDLHKDLVDLREELIEAIKAGEDRTDVVDLDQEIGRLSRMDALQQQKMAEAEAARHKIRLKTVIQALRAFEEDEYGFCKRCGELIDVRRLKARPESPCCVPCLRLVEAR
jgi:DnaK suppressor protein